MKKKIIVFLLLSIVIIASGCKKKNDWGNIFQFSEFTYEDSYIVGEVKNISENDYIAKIEFELVNGSIIEQDYEEIFVSSNSKKDIKLFNNLINTSYKIKIKNVQYEKTMEIDKSEMQYIQEEDLKKIFYFVNEVHRICKYNFSNNYKVESIFYAPNVSENKSSVKIIGDTTYYKIEELYNADRQRLEMIKITAKGDTMGDAPLVYKDFLQDLNHYYYDSLISDSDILKLYKVFRNGTTEEIGHFYISKSSSNDGESLNIYMFE